MTKLGDDHTRPPGSTEEWARRFDLLSDPTRLALLTHMHLHPDSPVVDLAAAAGITQTAASQALRVLRDQGWVEGRREGRSVLYRLIDNEAHAVLHLMGQQHHDHGSGAQRG
ncbi:MAG TPA: winged helix-turn-helix transcriptional regulator [Propionibacterium sp.]|jgi:DNA-binding transcriptional ArsR family regulator|nr:winged helix-turn-helix transcriptional regulator [Propionibacterium sp.]